ncbi:microtubule-associated protein TORTIFOLIA1 isoform X3 [Physcomitrium patens]|uniref:microtubule-associated protein TORTIFOLIA1 isoform X3 n=1 Tax=Physcomitrium patens TaxID=3218 RepID=UPI000D1663F0|nr:microtubule-associated protein TORTIFOLIA1-like isoform X3 [Physcomitrium patens]|eukprot:XP_024383377.1 microtubule-associated protein TORTIFOLIA1-like isoform X3 [Physcomitrella patens]
MRDSVGVWNNVGMELRHVGWVGLDILIAAVEKSLVRRNCIRLVGTLASLHGDLMACHLPKMVGNIVKRLKDPDSNIRDACVDTIGILASQIGGSDGGFTINVFMKPLLEALAEQHKTLQTGASMCLARVIENTRDQDLHTLHRLSPRILKMLGSPNFLAKAPLLNAVGAIFQVPGVVSISQLPLLLGSVQDELDSSEWMVRKAAADALSSMATAAGGSLGSYRGSVLAALENSRFDKVKPVRDSVIEALQLWKSVNDPNKLPSNTPAGSHDSASSTSIFEGGATPPNSDRKNSLRGSVNSSSSDIIGRPRSVCDKRAVAVKKRTPLLGDKKPNPVFSRKLDNAKDSIDSNHVAFPRDLPQVVSPRGGAASNEQLVYYDNCAETAPTSAYGADGWFTPEEGNGVDQNFDQEEGRELNPLTENGNCYEHPNPSVHQDRSETENHERWRNPLANGNQICEDESTCIVSSTNDGYKATADTGATQRHSHSLEHQHLSMMKMLQDSMARIHDSIHDLEGRVARLEQIVEDLAQSSVTTDGRSQVAESPRFQGSHQLGKYLLGNGFLNSKGGKGNEDTLVPVCSRSRVSSEKMAESRYGRSKEFSVHCGHQTPSVAEILSRPNVLGLSSLHRGNRADGESKEGNRRVGVLPQGEGPSARSVWHASKDEAIAAIRGASAPSKPHGKHAGWDSSADQKPIRMASGPFWMLWSQAMESVRSGDLDVAYIEILGCSDELLLVRLMSRTGPVLHQLNAGTVSQLLGYIKRFLQQQSFMDCIIPWLQQVSDLVSTNGPDTLGLTGDAKKDLVFTMQEASSMEYAQSWMGTKIAELAETVGNVLSSSGSNSTVDS